MHKGPITSVISDTSNKKIYTGGYDSCVYKWDIETGESKLLGRHKHLVNALAISKNGKLLASASSDYSITIYDLSTENKIRTLIGHSDDVEAISFASNEILISTSRDHRCLVWNVGTGAIINEFLGHTKDVLSVWTFNDNVFTTGDDGRIIIWNFKTMQLVGEIGPFSYELDTVSGTDRKKLFAVGADNGNVKIYSAIDLKLVSEFHAHIRGVKKVSFSPSGDFILTAGYDHHIKIWSTSDFNLIRELEPYKYQWERSFAWSNDEESIFGSSFGVSYCEWNVNNGKLKSRNIERATPSINEIAVTDNLIATASDDGRFRVNGKDIYKSNGILTNAIGISLNGQYILWGDHAGFVHIIEHQNNKYSLQSLSLGSGPINSIFFDKYDESFYVGTYGGFLHNINPKLKTENYKWKAHEGAVKAVQADSKLIASVSADGSIHVYDKNNLEEYQNFVGSTAINNDVYLDSERERIIVASRDKLLRIFDINSGRIIAQHSKHRYSIKSVTVNQDGSIISGDYWGYCVFWNPENGYLSNPTRVATNGISSLKRYKEDVFASSYDGGIYRINRDLKITEYGRLFNQKKENILL